MEKSTEISLKFWNLPQKPIEELNRENNFIDDIIQKSHIEKEILSHLDGIETVFDGGAGYGRFSILLAKLGLKVTHFDISSSMIEKAKEIAQKAAELAPTNNRVTISAEDVRPVRWLFFCLPKKFVLIQCLVLA